MARKIVIPLNAAQKRKIKKKLGRVCNTIRVDAEDLIRIVRYLSPQVCIDFDEKQEEVIKKAFPDMECDFAVIDKSDLGGMVKYMPPPAKRK